MKIQKYTWIAPVMVFSTGIILFTNEDAKQEHQTVGLYLSIAAIILLVIIIRSDFFPSKNKKK